MTSLAASSSACESTRAPSFSAAARAVAVGSHTPVHSQSADASASFTLGSACEWLHPRNPRRTRRASAAVAVRPAAASAVT